ncbi:unnamed protein product [Dovyalis caffra]|uniref:Uncharacterized protein n=1 Tax=Dovyalis caffra TaxID=77055 RepID=A0AAV1R833_9ROSI|nr:unnamed protein product [Dovyalis caffra]
MKGGITGRLQEAKLREQGRPLHKLLAEKARGASLHSLLSQGPRPPSQPALFRRILHPWAYGLAGLPFPPELHGRCPVPQSDHLVWSAPIVFGQRSLHSFTLVHPAMPRAFCSSNVKGGRPFVKAQESAGHLSGGIEYPHPIEVPF